MQCIATQADCIPGGSGTKIPQMIRNKECDMKEKIQDKRKCTINLYCALYPAEYFSRYHIYWS
jgi:hypothetical protein